MRDKRILPSERCRDGECAVCGRRHIHKDDCATLKRREDSNNGTDPDKPPVPYAGGLFS
jgi:hypothetical protein